MLIRTHKFKIYIDFDGVIKDTNGPLFDDYNKTNSHGQFVSDTEHVIKKDWIYVLEKSPIINDAIKTINEIDDDTAVCTRVHSLENESVAKIRDLRQLGLKREIILVPYLLKKTDVVPAEGNILTDDAVFNLDEWYCDKGIPIFFDNYGTNQDGWGVKNKKYVRTRTLDILKDRNKLEEIIRYYK